MRQGRSRDYCFIGNHVNSGLVWVDGMLPQSYELTRGTTELVQHFRLEGEFIGVRALLDINLKWFGCITFPVGRRGDILLVQMIITCLQSAWGGGGGGVQHHGVASQLLFQKSTFL
jgi:hypothetical protein